MPEETIYARALRELLAAGLMSRDDAVLVVAGGPYDAATLREAGFAEVVISNLDTRMRADAFAPYGWSLQDAEALSYPDGAFDHVLVHAGLHHCRSPHRALCEMMRVARRGVLVVESRDSLLMRLAVRLGLTAEHELEAVIGNGGDMGGVANTGVPNFVYRWTEREVRKTVESFDPARPARLAFLYGLRLPLERLDAHHAPWKGAALRLAAGMAQGLGRLFPRQGNLFAFHVDRTAPLHPWIREAPDGPRLDPEIVRIGRAA